MNKAIISKPENIYWSNSGSSHFVESVGKKSVVLLAGVKYAIGLPTIINKLLEQEFW